MWGRLSRAAAIAALAACGAVSASMHAAHAALPEAIPEAARGGAVCDAFGKCQVLFGQSTGGEQPALANLVADIALILDAPENKWVKTRDRPPASITMQIADVLRKCFDKIMSLKKFLLHPCLASAHPPTVPITQSPIPWGPERERLMSEYMLKNTGDPSTALVNPTTVVLHWTDTPSYESAYNTFKPESLAGRGDLSRAGNVNVSCHFIVDRDGTIHQLQPLDKVARHAVGMNRDALCIENVGVAHRDKDGSLEALTDEQLKSDEELVKELVATYPTIDNVIGHSEYRSFEDTYIFHELDRHYRSDRDSEPGKKFLSHFRRDMFEAGEDLRRTGRCTQSPSDVVNGG